jgi:hypothetical protein
VFWLFNFIHLFPVHKGDMNICTPEKNHISRRQRPREIWLFRGWTHFHISLMQGKWMFYFRVPVNWETKRNETKTKSNEICKVRKRNRTKWNEICKVRKRNPTKRNDKICKVRKQHITKRNEIYKVRKQYQMKKNNEFCKVRQESKRNKRLFFVSTTRDIQ